MATIRPLVIYPDPILHQPSLDVTKFDTELKSLIDDMSITMRVADGIGLSAIQIGVPLRVITYVNGPDEVGVLVNPTITSWAGEQSHEEGCLSVPGVFERRVRYESIMVEYCNAIGVRWVLGFTGLQAFCIQHEMDHLEGKVFIDDLSPLKKNRARDTIKKTIRRFKRDVNKISLY